MMARMYTGCYDLISFRNAYHGMSPATNGLTAHSTWRYNIAGNFGIHQVNWGLEHIRSCVFFFFFLTSLYLDDECRSLSRRMGWKTLPWFTRSNHSQLQLLTRTMCCVGKICWSAGRSAALLGAKGTRWWFFCRIHSGWQLLSREMFLFSNNW